MADQPTPLEVARSIVKGLLNDGRIDAMPLTAAGAAELIARIAHVIEGERDMARQWFDYYAIPEPRALSSRAAK